MGDTNAKNNKSRNKGKKSAYTYTNLGPAYIVKTIVLFFVGLITVAFADTFEMTFIGALTSLSGIGFDLVIVSMSNNGPRQKWTIRVAKIASCIIVCVCFFMIVYFVIKDSEMMNSIRNYYLSTTGENAYIGRLIIKIIIILFSVIGPLTEYFYNKPNDNSDDEEEDEAEN